MDVLFPDPAGRVRNITHCSWPPLAFNFFTLSSISADGLPPRLFFVKWTRLCLNHVHPLQCQEGKYMPSFHMICTVFHPVAVSLALQLFLLFLAVLVLFWCGWCCDHTWGTFAVVTCFWHIIIFNLERYVNITVICSSNQCSAYQFEHCWVIFIHILWNVGRVCLFWI